MSDFPSFDAPPPTQPGGTPSAPPPGWWQASDGNWYPPSSAPGGASVPGGMGGPLPMPGPMPGAGYGWVQAGTQVGTNGLAIASLVLGIIWVYWIGSILAIIFGHVAIGQIKKTGQQGRGLAIAGLVLGYIGAFFLVVTILVLVFGDVDVDSGNF